MATVKLNVSSNECGFSVWNGTPSKKNTPIFDVFKIEKEEKNSFFVATRNERYNNLSGAEAWKLFAKLYFTFINLGFGVQFIGPKDFNKALFQD